MKLFELKQERAQALNSAEAVLNRAEDQKRGLTAEEQQLFDAHMKAAEDLAPKIAAIEERNSLPRMFNDGAAGLIMGAPEPNGDRDAAHYGSAPAKIGQQNAAAEAFRGKFASWMNNTLETIGGASPRMGATSPAGPISIGTGSGLDSIGITVPTEILPYMPSYYALDSFGLAGATQIYTDHTRPLVKPIISAGAADSAFAENAAPGTSQPFGLSAFTFGGTKYARLVLASYESLMNSELPLQGTILDELLAGMATTLTQATTTSFVAALTAASSTLAVGVGGSGGSTYTSMIDLRHAVPPRFDLPANKWMLSRATLALIRNTKASTSGVPLFSPDGTKLFDREYVINDNLDSASGAGVGFVAFGSFVDGVWIRKTPLITRVFQELYAQSGQVGYRTQQWADSHFLAELVGAAHPPTFQPIYYTNVASES